MRFVLIVVFVTIFFTFFPSPIFASSLSSTKYMYDNVGNIQSINNPIDPSKNLSYSYDDLYRLLMANQGPTGSQSTIGSYLYDHDGDITTKNEDSVLTLSYTPTDPIASHAPKSVNGRLLKYDLNGNLIEDSFSNLKITYDYENRPVEIRKLDTNTLLAKYFYDGEGKRVKKEVYDSSIPSAPLKSTTEYVNQYYEKEVPVGKPSVVRKFYAGAAYRENSTLTYTTTDHLSSTTLLTNASGVKQAEYRYYPYGNAIQATNPLPPNSWIGQKHDDESGLYFLNARYYSPKYGRFVQSDIVEDATARGNRFVYSADNPIGLKDTTGTSAPQDAPVPDQPAVQAFDPSDPLAVQLASMYEKAGEDILKMYGENLPENTSLSLVIVRPGDKLYDFMKSHGFWGMTHEDLPERKKLFMLSKLPVLYCRSCTKLYKKLFIPICRTT